MVGDARTETNMITTSSGTIRNRLAKDVMISSAILPKKQERNARTVPISVEKNPDTSASKTVSRKPFSKREKISCPISSVPKRCSRHGAKRDGWLKSVTSYGMRNGAANAVNR